MAVARPLQGCMIALSGNFPGLTHSAVETDFVNVLGAALTKSVNEDTTHLVTTNFDLTKPSAKVKQAKLHDVHIVSLQWPKDCKEQDLKSSENDYSLAANTATAATTASGSCKRTTNDDAGGNNSQPKSKKTKAAAANGFQMQSQDASQSTSANSTKASSKPAVELKVEREFRDGPTNVVKSSAVNIFIDETCTFTHYTVYIDSDGVIFDTNLNQTNARNNNNKFYRLQILKSGNSDFKTWSRWCRVGERGESAILGDGSRDDAIRQFEKKFKDKTGLIWANRGDNPKANKHIFVERSYDDSDDEQDAQGGVKIYTQYSRELLSGQKGGICKRGSRSKSPALVASCYIVCSQLKAIRLEPSKIKLWKERTQEARFFRR